jgi:hypothetical protein
MSRWAVTDTTTKPRSSCEQVKRSASQFSLLPQFCCRAAQASDLSSSHGYNLDLANRQMGSTPHETRSTRPVCRKRQNPKIERPDDMLFVDFNHPCDADIGERHWSGRDVLVSVDKARTCSPMSNAVLSEPFSGSSDSEPLEVRERGASADTVSQTYAQYPPSPPLPLAVRTWLRPNGNSQNINRHSRRLKCRKFVFSSIGPFMGID